MLVRAAAVHSSETTYTYAVSRTDEVVGRGLESLRESILEHRSGSGDAPWNEWRGPCPGWVTGIDIIIDHCWNGCHWMAAA